MSLEVIINLDSQSELPCKKLENSTNSGFKKSYPHPTDHLKKWVNAKKKQEYQKAWSGKLL